MSKFNEDDYFESSTMSFGEHLEELRTCLIRSIVGLVIGFLVGLLIGGNVVEIIQMPLKGALIKYYQGRSTYTIDNKEDVLISHGYGADIRTLPKNYGLVAEELLVNPTEIALLLGIDPATLPKESPFKDKVEKKDFAKTPEELALGDESWSVADYFSFEKWGRYISNMFASKNIDLSEDVSKTVRDEAIQGAATEETQLVSMYVWKRSENDHRAQVRNFAVQETFMIYIKASLLAGVILASPWVFWQIWSFVAAGLYPHEKRYVHVFLPFSLGLFLGGAFLAFFFVFQPVLEFLFSFNQWMGIEPEPRISEWLNFFLLLPIGFGISFQLPLVMLFLERIGVVTASMYVTYWRVAILMIFFISMLLTPADPTSMVLMAIPLSFLYFGGVILCKIMPRSKNPFAEENPA
ncbi:MAG: twin-arginine translocase subunit TatC [Planctomycetia bacterium]|nr:twin-arginine translocase subunit TatC [Planctomycetia bacterium]